MACTVEQFLDFLKKEEKSEATISKYAYELQMFLQFLGKREIGKELMIQYRTYLSSRYRPQTVNGKLSAVNAFLKFTGLYEYRVKFLKVQRRAYLDETRELTLMSVKGGGKIVYNYSLIGKLILVIWNRLFLLFHPWYTRRCLRQLIFYRYI